MLFLGLFIVRLFEKIFYKVWQTENSFTNFKSIIIKCDRYHKGRQNLLQSATDITKGDKRLLQSVTGITMYVSCYKVRRNTNFN